MRKIQIAIVLIMTMSCSMAYGEITLKKSFFSGWKYSVNGGGYKKVGFSGTSLYAHMEGDDEAQQYMKKYKSAMTWGAVTGYPGGFLIGWPLGGYLGSGGDWKDGYTTMVIIGAPLAIVSFIFEASATRNLKKAVKAYNGDEESLGLRLEFRNRGPGNAMTGFLSFKYEF